MSSRSPSRHACRNEGQLPRTLCAVRTLDCLYPTRQRSTSFSCHSLWQRLCAGFGPVQPVAGYAYSRRTPGCYLETRDRASSSTHDWRAGTSGVDWVLLWCSLMSFCCTIHPSHFATLHRTSVIWHSGHLLDTPQIPVPILGLSANLKRWETVQYFWLFVIIHLFHNILVSSSSSSSSSAAAAAAAASPPSSTIIIINITIIIIIIIIIIIVIYFGINFHFLYFFIFWLVCYLCFFYLLFSFLFFFLLVYFISRFI